jgi:proprotein convertase subtilisin/kexin type 5
MNLTTQNTCDCALGYGVMSTNPIKQCSKCPDDALSCDFDGTTPTDVICRPGKNLDETGESPICADGSLGSICSEGENYFFNPVTLTCERCDDNCATCSITSDNCTTCIQNTHLEEVERVDGYYTNSCVEDPRFRTHYDGPAAIAPTRVLQESLFTAESCRADPDVETGCFSCDESNCTACSDVTETDVNNCSVCATNEFRSGGVCTACDAGCKSCRTESDTCTSCGES